jgi:hypothetical protein
MGSRRKAEGELIVADAPYDTDWLRKNLGNIDVAPRAIAIAILAVAEELRLNRESMESGPGWKIAAMQYDQLKAMTQGGIVQPIVLPGGRSNH